MSDDIFLIGLGSAGQRHAQLFRRINPSINMYSTNRYLSSRHIDREKKILNEVTAAEMYGIRLGSDRKRYSVGIISLPIGIQYDNWRTWYNCCEKFYIEKPLFLPPHFDISSEKSKPSVLFQQRFSRYFSLFNKMMNDFDDETPSRIEFKHIEDLDNAYSYYSNDRSFYFSDNELYGGVFTTLCHELDLILKKYDYSSDMEINELEFFPKGSESFISGSFSVNEKRPSGNKIPVQFALGQRKDKPEKEEKQILFEFNSGFAVFDFKYSKYLSFRHGIRSEFQLFDRNQCFLLQAKMILSNLQAGTTMSVNDVEMSSIEDAKQLSRVFLEAKRLINASTHL